MWKSLFAACLIVTATAGAAGRADECVRGDCVAGKGEMRYEDGSRYVGEWRDSRRNGRGIHYRANGGVLDGQWQDDRPKGYGSYRFTNRARYAAEWTGGARTGLDPDAWSVGGVYVGQHDGRENGEGTVMYSDGVTYVGGYRDGKKTGKGTMVRTAAPTERASSSCQAGPFTWGRSAPAGRKVPAA